MSNVDWSSGDTATFGGTPGTVTVTGTQTTSGMTFSSSSGTYTLSGGIIDFSSSGDPAQAPEITANTPAIINSSIQGSANSALSVGGNGTLTFNGSISGFGCGLSLTGSGTVVLNAANTYTGENDFTGATVRLGANGTLGNQANGLFLEGATLDLNGADQSIGDLSAYSVSGLMNSQIVNNASGTNVTLTVGSDNASVAGPEDGYIGNILDHTSGTGTVALTKVGTGTIRLAGQDTYTGNTTINGGELDIDNTALNSSPGSGTGLGNVLVNKGGTLGGFGVIAPSAGNTITIASGGRISPTALTEETPSNPYTIDDISYISPLTFNNASTSGIAPFLVFSQPTGDTASLPQLTFSLNASLGTIKDTLRNISYLEANPYISITSTSDNVITTIQFNNNLIQINDLTGGQLALGNYLLIEATSRLDYNGLTVSSTGQITAGLTLADSSPEFNGDELFMKNGDIYLDVVSIPEPSVVWLELMGATMVFAAGGPRFRGTRRTDLELGERRRRPQATPFG